ncbi:MAG: hypothetical protein QGH40_05510, partial [bacterium]|nr:hypothetical protein [bacterium]
MVISVKNIKCSGPFLTILLVALFLSDITCPASFATTPLPFPELPKADVGITRAVYRAAINLEGTAADGDNLIPVEVTVTGQAVGEGWARNRIFPQAMPIQDFPGSEDLFLDFADGTYLSARAPSEFSFLFSIPTRPEPSNNGHSLRIPVVFASVTRIELTVTTPDNRPVTITTDPPAPVTSTLNDDSWKVSVTPAPGTTLDLTVAAEPATARAATFSVSQDLSVFMAPGLVETNIGCTVQPLQGLTDRVIIETDRVITGLMGEMIESWNEEVSETGKSIVTLKLYSALEASFAFRILFQAEHPPGAPFTIPSVDFPEAAKVSGTITIRTEKNYYPVEESTLNVNRLSAAKDQIAYHFDTPDYRLTMGLKPDLLKFDARGTVLIEIWPDMIRTIADIELDVISGSLETCAIRLPAEFRCQSVSGSRISGWKPATGGISVNVGGLRDGQTVMKLEGFVPLQKGYPLKLRVPEFTGARNSHGIVGIRVLGHKIPEVNKPVNLFQTSKVNLPAWMKNISLAFQYSGKNISGNIALVKPVPTVDIQSVTLLEITNTNVIQETRARITVNQAPLFCLSIIPGGNAELDEISGALLADFERGPEGIVTLRFTRPLEPGKTEEFSFITLRPRPEGNDIRFPLPAYPGARHVEGYVAAKSRVEAMLSWKQLGKAEECGPGQLPYTWFTIGRGDHLLTFRHPGTVNLTMKQLPIRFKQSSESVFTISPSLVAASSRVTLNIEQGGMKWILLKLPDGAKKPEIRSHFLAGVQPFKDGWRIEFSSILKGETTLAVDYSIPFEQSAGFIELAPPEFSGRSRHTGVLGFKSTSDIELTESFDGMQGLARLKGTPPPDLKDIHSLYRLTEAGFPRLKLLISKVQHQEKQKAEISELTLQTLMESDSAVMTGVSAKINNPGNKQFLKVWLPESAELWGAYVDGKPVKSGQEESDGPPAHTIPLITKQADRSFTIQLVYRQAGIDRFSTAGKVSLQAPQMDVPVGKVSWDVQIPEGYRLMMPGGNMALVRSPRLDTPGIADVFVRSLSSILSWATPYLRALGYLLGTLLTWLWYAVLIGLLGGLVYLGILAVVWFLKVMVRIEIGPSLEFATKALILLFIIGIFAA